ncbi:polar amino acid transport system substrate-binding protein [Inhella inkyongensis]|uniref:Polar amino acid transport system substrate-binding protein n=1 Tax=Inhella inkyongensis TaxID=392593 RepID=A0A840S7M2_9BURK|nr:transporter substrate-binding domain-containing protein [Inhella inkyongensis]MBB5204784.1 polar amino acid transport system substrate-binding protein [Inhella inkyongensis]
MNVASRLCAALLFATALPLGAAENTEPLELRVCTGDDESYPWHFNDRPGLAVLLMRRVELRVNGLFRIEPKPWKRCLLELVSGQVDAAYKASYSAERAADGVTYPMLGAQPDLDKRLLTESYSLFRRKGSAVQWDGRALKVNGPVGAQTGFSVAAQLRQLGATVDEGNRKTDGNLQKLLNGWVVAVALQTQEGDAQLQQNPEFAAAIERVQPPLVEKPYFLVFSKAYYARRPDQAQLIWSTIAQVRESADYRRLVEQFK